MKPAEIKRITRINFNFLHLSTTGSIINLKTAFKLINKILKI